MRRILAKAVVSSCGEKPFSRRCWRRRTTILRELNSVRPLSEGAAERRLLHHRAIDDFVDGDAVAHGEHGQDTPPRDVDALAPQLLDQIVVELVRQPSDQMRKEIIEHRLVRRFRRLVRRFQCFVHGASRAFVSSHVQSGLWPLRMAPSFGASMLPPETIQIMSPLPACPAMAAATDAAPAASVMM